MKGRKGEESNRKERRDGDGMESNGRIWEKNLEKGRDGMGKEGKGSNNNS